MNEKSGSSIFRTLGLLYLATRPSSARGERTVPNDVSTPGDEPAAPDAQTPVEFEAGDWKSVIGRTLKEVSNDHVMLVAAGVTFYAILALFPALAALVSIYGLFADPLTIQDQLMGLQGVVPGGGLDIIEGQLEALSARDSTGLGVALVLGLGTSLWSANAGVKSIFEALNIAYEETETRGFVKLTLVALAFTLAGIFFTILALVAVVAIPILLQQFPFGDTLRGLLTWLRWPLMLVVSALLISLLYRFGPSRQPPRWRWVSWGSGLAAVLWLGASVLFSWYAANFGSYDATYGSLGAAIGFMTWIWISAIVIITGAELNSELEHQTRADTTTGAREPMGARGAAMADRAAGQTGLTRSRGDAF